MSCEANLPRRACRRRRRTVGPRRPGARGARRSRHDRWAGGDSWLFRERCRIGPRFCLYPGRGQSWPAGPAGRLSATADSLYRGRPRARSRALDSRLGRSESNSEKL